MEEAVKGEVFIEDLDEGTLDSLITFIYTGDFKITQDIKVQNMARAGDKYNIPEFAELLVYKLKHEATIKPETVADILQASNMYSNEKLKEVAMENIRANRSIVNDEDFRKTIDEAGNKLLFDIINDL